MLSNTKISDYFHSRYRGMIIGLLIAVFLVYLPFINNALFFDDLFFMGKSAAEYAKAPFQLIFLNLRFIPYLTIGWTWKYFLDTPLPLHLGNMLLHGINTLLLFFLLLQLLSLAVPKNSSPKDNPTTYLPNRSWGAWLGALCFACHPVAVYATGYVMQRSILMATLFTLAMQLTFLRGLISPKKNHQYAFLATSVLFYFLAVFSKEHCLTAPAILVPMTLLLKPYIQANRQVLIATALGFLSIAVFITLKAKGVFGAMYEHDAVALFEQQVIVDTAGSLHLLSIVTQAGLFFKYLFLWALPNPAWMSIDMRESFASSISSWQNLLKIIAFIAYGFVSLKLLLRKGQLGLIGFALLYPWLMFIVEFSSVRVQEPFVLYRSYLWAPGLMLLISLLFQSLSFKKRMLFALAIPLVLIPISWNRLWVFADDYRLWNDAAILLDNDKVPGAARIFYNRGNAEINNQKPYEAISDFKRVVFLFPKLEQAHTNLGDSYLRTRQYMHALESFNQVIEINPDNGQAYLGKALALNRLHKRTESIEALNSSCKLKNVTACLTLAAIQRN